MNHDVKTENLERKKELRAVSLFDYIEKKEQEYKIQRHELLKSIVLKQRVKIAQKQSEWAQHCQKIKQKDVNLKRELLAKKQQWNQSKKREKQLKLPKSLNEKTITSKTGSQLQSKQNSTHNIFRESSRMVFKRDPSSIERESSRFEFSSMSSTRPSILHNINDSFHSLELLKPKVKSPEPEVIQENNELTEIQVKVDMTKVETKIKKIKDKIKDKKGKKERITKTCTEEPNAAVLSVFKTMDAYNEFQKKYHENFDKLYMSSHLEQENLLEKHASVLERRKEKFKIMHGIAQRNRERIESFINGSTSTVPLGIPQGFKIVPHPITDEVIEPLTQPQEDGLVDEKINIQADASELEAIRLKNQKDAEGLNAVSRRTSFATSKRPSNSSFTEDKKENKNQDHETKEINLELSRQRQRQGRRSTLYKQKSSSNKLHSTAEEGYQEEADEEEGSRIISKSFRSNISNDSFARSFREEEDGEGSDSFFIPNAIMLDDHPSNGDSLVQGDETQDFIQDIPERKSTLYRERSMLSRKSSKSSIISENRRESNSSKITLPTIVVLHDKPQIPITRTPKNKQWDPLFMDAVLDFSRVLPSTMEKQNQQERIHVNPSYAKAAELQEYGHMTKGVKYHGMEQVEIVKSKSQMILPKSVKYWSTWSEFTDDLK